MTQPDLVSKLRELKAKGKVGWMDSTDFADELGHAFGGNKVYPDAEDCRRAHPCIDSAAETYPCSVQRVIVFDADELESLLGPSATPEKVEVCGVCGDFLAGDYCATCDAHRTQAPSTPIVPSTAGLSAIDWQDVRRIDKEVHEEMWRDTMKGEHEDVWKEFTRRLNIQIRLNRIAANVEQVVHESYAKEREAQIRKDVLREAFLLRPGLPHEWNSTQFREGYYAGLEAYRQAIEKALAERPAPAGEVKEEN